jgi:hypothetical protein
MSSTHRKQKKASASPVSAFVQAVTAAGLVAEAGKGAVQKAYRDRVNGQLANTQFTGSVDMDEAFRLAEGQANRWDYGLGVQHAACPEMAVWVEPHPASSHGEVKVVLAKLAWLKAKLQLPAFGPLKALTDACAQQGVLPYRWVSSGAVAIRAGSREAHMLALAGMGLPTRQVVL